MALVTVVVVVVGGLVTVVVGPGLVTVIVVATKSTNSVRIMQ